MIRVALAGVGAWGRNHLKTLATLPGVRVTWVVEPDADRRAEAGRLAPTSRLAEDVGEALRDTRLDALVVASPGPTHGPLARAALRAGKHVLVEKPLTPTAEESWDLVRRARRADRLLGVGHLLLYHPAVVAMRRLVQRGDLGAIRYIHCQRTNLGRIRDDEGALVGLAPHDLSVMVHLLGAWPLGVAARGGRYAQPRLEDLVFLTLRFPGKVLGHVHLSWLDPKKERRISVVGDGLMAVFDDMDPAHKLRVHGQAQHPAGRRRRLPATPRLPDRQPLREELRAFVRCIKEGTPLPTPGEDGARAIRVLDAAQRSLEAGGQEMALRIR